MITSCSFPGYKTFFHGGDLTGFHSEVFIIPDMDVATFFTTNFGGHTRERQFVHQYLSDILLGIDPAINASFVCDILEENVQCSSQYNKCVPVDLVESDVIHMLRSLEFSDTLIKYYYTDNTVGNFPGFPQHLMHELHEIIESNSDAVPWRQIESYIGEYGHFVFGNLSVTVSVDCEDCLFMQYGSLGQYTLRPTNTSDVFLGVNANFMLSVTPVVFSGSDENGNAEFVSPVFFQVTGPLLFRRGLKMADAPPPRIDICHY